ncbi:hypothetical protein F5879DRAFT_1024810 [Lentinula edodes]|uniref:uncharacterized protein n=1 Tax=Lentinula edodes TaxID=5353 RepID=UPI001E8ECA2E|nr:uncharacterized protein C8R40DRAFT_1115258 [Lentinula edodes]KAH7873021.1 hypothetical protein C8R40DRAFT_1115258 [Lentinula edodes]KAJ3901385.1 hypothetical protein F5879DRAFT_1024810 [Lentinula edodes]
MRLSVNGTKYSGTTAMWCVPLHDRHHSGGWCLVNSNNEQEAFPLNLLESSLFVIQAESPREKHFRPKSNFYAPILDIRSSGTCTEEVQLRLAKIKFM